MLLRRIFTLCCLLSSVASFAGSPAAGRSKVDILIVHGTVIPIAGDDIADGAIAIRGSEIVAVGTTSALQHRYSARETIDATGSAVLPGFVNAHTHVPMTLFRGIADDRDLMDWLQHFIFPAEAKNVDRDFVRWGTRLAAAEMIASGTTTFADMYYFEADIADETEKAGLRGVLGETLIDFPAPDNKSWDGAITYSRDFVKRYKNHALITPALAPHSPYTVSAEHLKQVRQVATDIGAPILIHVAETTAELETVRQRGNGATPVGYLDSLGFLGADVVAAHGIWVNDADIAILARRGTGVVHCPESNMMLASGIAPVVDLRHGGVATGLGTDGPAGSNNNLDMIEEMASAARLQKITRKDPKALTAKDVLTMATLEGARVLGLGKRIGSLEAGKLADVIIIDLSGARTQPVYSAESAIVYAANGANVQTTIVNGKILMRDRRLLTVDRAAAVAHAAQYRDRIVASLKAQ